ncbi:WD repeat-containing protein DWA1 [Acorus calamus]|uniref:WD repeat-containing protein DWA1 n=1 Tax=Acorus calamus TaxID=4465 RepID=A0AAV9CDQ5_ACOCL|nr:WD repeat-containing protein DWA1 [Acorus calamus]
MMNGRGNHMGDARDWDEGGCRRSILSERELQCRTVFRTAFTPSNPRNDHDVLVVASSDGSVAPYDLSSSSMSPPAPSLPPMES